jgi:hypothetical protein
MAGSVQPNLPPFVVASVVWQLLPPYRGCDSRGGLAGKDRFSSHVRSNACLRQERLHLEYAWAHLSG